MLNKIKVMLDEGAKMPTRAYPSDAGLDLYTPYNFRLYPDDHIVIDTGVHLLIPEGYCGLVVSKSGLNVNHGITSTGLIDAGYTGSIKISLYGHDEMRDFHTGDKISQIVILPIETPELELVDRAEKTERGDNGFGSTGV